MRGAAARTSALYAGDLSAKIQQQTDHDPRVARKAMASNIDEAVRLKAGVLLSTGKIDEITLMDLQAVFKALSIDGGEAVYFRYIDDFLEKCLDCSAVELNMMHQHINKGLGGIMYPSQLHQALQVKSIKAILLQAHRQKITKEDESHLEGDAHVERPFLVERVRWRVNRDDAFGTLPFTGIYLIVFMLLVVYHLRIWERQELERGLETAINSSGQNLYGPFIKNHVYSAGSFNDWLLKSGLKAILGNVVDVTGGEEVRIATSNVLIGDLQLRQSWGDSYDERLAWLLGSSIGKAYLADHVNDTDRLSRASSDASRYYLDYDNGWIDDNTNEISLAFYSYNNQAEMYGETRVWLRLDRLGFVVPLVKARGFIVFPYPAAWMYVVDAIYLFMILHTLYNESKDMCAAIALGFRSFIHYWTFWNTVDWITIWLGFLNVGLWLLCCISMQDDILHDYLARLDEKWVVKQSVVPMPSITIETLQDSLATLGRYSFILSCSLAFTAVFIVLKFFKGFEANPRLQTVTLTLKAVRTDVFHFSVVLLPLFFTFGTIGHVLFGQDITSFYTLANSFNTGIAVLMGEFSWYAELSDTPAIMPSGMPRFVLAIWFVSYLGFVLLIMINLLLAIVLEKYSEVYHILSHRSDARTLAQQTQRFIRRKIEMRSFVPLYKISHMLEDDSDPAHPQEVVTHDSLKDAFMGMSDKQADWLVSFLRTELKEMIDHRSKLEDFNLDRSLRVERMVQSIAEELHVVGVAVKDCIERISSMEAAILRNKTWITHAATPRDLYQPETPRLDAPDNEPIPSEFHPRADSRSSQVRATKFGPTPSRPERDSVDGDRYEDALLLHRGGLRMNAGDSTYFECCL